MFDSFLSSVSMFFVAAGTSIMVLIGVKDKELLSPTVQAFDPAEQLIVEVSPSTEPSRTPEPTTTPSVSIRPSPSEAPIIIPTPVPSPSTASQKITCEEGLAKVKQEAKDFADNLRFEQESQKRQIMQEIENIDCSKLTSNQCRSKVNELQEKLRNVHVEGMPEDEFLYSINQKRLMVLQDCED